MGNKMMPTGGIGGTSQSMIPFEAQRKPTEYGKIMKWREGEILGLGSSSIVYSAINTKDNSMIAVKKFKIVSDVTGIDQNKLKIVKVSRICYFTVFTIYLIWICLLYRMRYRSISN